MEKIDRTDEETHNTRVFSTNFFLWNAVQNINRGQVWGLIKHVSAGKEPIKLQKFAMNRSHQPSLLRMGRKLMKIKKVRPIILFALDILTTSKNSTIEKVLKCDREIPMPRDTGASLTFNYELTSGSESKL